MHYSRGMLSLSAPYPPSHLRELSLFHERSHRLPVVSQTPPSLERRVVSSSCLPLSHTTAAVSLFDSFISGTPCLATWKPLFYRLSICVRVGFGLVVFLVRFHPPLTIMAVSHSLVLSLLVRDNGPGW